MLSNSKLPRTFWGEAVNTTLYLINKSPSTALNFKTRQEVWSGHPPNFKHLRVFGCAAYAHTRQDKLQPRAKKCIFLGYPQGVKAYKLWSLEPGENKCFISRDITFDESLMPWKENSTKDSGKDADKDKFEIKLQPLTNNAENRGHNETDTVEPYDSYHVEIDEINTQAETQFSDQEQSELTDYDQLIRDKQRRVSRPSTRYEMDFVGYTFNCYMENLEQNQTLIIKQLSLKIV